MIGLPDKPENESDDRDEEAEHGPAEASRVVIRRLLRCSVLRVLSWHPLRSKNICLILSPHIPRLLELVESSLGSASSALDRRAASSAEGASLRQVRPAAHTGSHSRPFCWVLAPWRHASRCALTAHHLIRCSFAACFPTGRYGVRNSPRSFGFPGTRPLHTQRPPASFNIVPAAKPSLFDVALVRLQCWQI